jgi:cytoskeletal protein CcmA (bactofilin family)
MARIFNLNDNRAIEQTRRIATLERASPLENSSVTRGRVRIASNEGLLVEGSQKVSGWLVVTGTLKVLGSFLLEGATTMTGNLISSGTALFSGAFTTKGTTRFEGDTTQKGPFHVEGATDVTGNMTVKTGGKLVVEGTQKITLQSVSGTATLQFSDGPRVWSQSGAARMDAGPGAGIVLSTAEAAILRSPDTATAVAVSNTGTRIFGDVYLMNLPTISGVTANVTVDPDTGELGVV